MSDKQAHRVPDYDLAEEVVADRPEQLKALANPVRSHILDLVMDRAATVSELAEALDRPRSSVAYHVTLLCEIGLLKVVRTRKVRAIDERFYGRTGRTIVFGDGRAGGRRAMRQGFLAEAHAEAPQRGDFRATLRHARIAEEDAEEFFARVAELAAEFTRLPRRGTQVMGFVAAVYPTDHPALPERDEPSD